MSICIKSVYLIGIKCVAIIIFINNFNMNSSITVAIFNRMTLGSLSYNSSKNSWTSVI